MPEIRLLCGPGRSGRMAAINAQMRLYWGRSLLITPTQAYAVRRREELLLGGDLPGSWGHPVRSFTDFVSWLLEAEGCVVRRVDNFGQRLLLEPGLRGMESEGRLSAIGAGPDNSGLITHLLRIIAQLKQAAVEPEVFAARVEQQAVGGPFDGIVSEAYGLYQGALKARGLYDIPGMYWEADLRCRASRPKALAGVEALFFDGFDDFTPSEFRLIEALAPHVHMLMLGMNHDELPNRQDLYVLSAQAIRRIETRFGITATPCEALPSASYSEYAADTIFWRDRPRFSETLRANLKLLPCIDRSHELEVIARGVKRLLSEGQVSPNAIAVVFRHLPDAAGRVRSVFREYGIPYRMQAPPRLSESGLGAFLKALFEAMQQGERDAVLDTLTSPWWASTADRGLLAEAAPLLARTAQVMGGFEEWRTRLNGLADRLENGDDDEMASLRRRLPEAAAFTRALCGAVERVEAFGALLPAAGPVSAMAGILDGYLETLVLAKSEAANEEDERSALGAMRGLLETLSDVAGGEDWPRDRFIRSVLRGIEETPYVIAGPPYGVMCLDAASIRNLSFEHVFFGGLIEGAAPRPPVMSAIYSERDLSRLRAIGIPLEGRREHSARERLLFHHVLESVQGHLTLTWALQKEGGRESMPSAFLMDVQELFPAEAGVMGPSPRADSFLPGWEEAGSERDVRNVVFSRPEWLQAHASAFPAYAAAAVVERQRQDTSAFGTYDGVLSAPDLVECQQARYGPEHVFSVDQVETYQDCPFRFFAMRVLNVDVVETPAAEFDPRVLGIILHYALQRFHQRYVGIAVAALPEGEADRAMEQGVEEAFRKFSRRSATTPPGVAAMEQRRMQTVLKRYLRIERQNGDSRWLPQHFEVAFGNVRGPKDDSLCRAAPVAVDTGREQVLFSGRIDRIDLDGRTARVLDYKSSSPPSAKEIISGLSLQLTVYAWVLEQALLPGVTCSEGAYVQVGRRLTKKNPYREALGLGVKGYESREANVRLVLSEAVSGIRSGRFFPTPAMKKSCTYCPWRAACRYEKSRVERKGGRPISEDDEEVED